MTILINQVPNLQTKKSKKLKSNIYKSDRNDEEKNKNRIWTTEEVNNLIHLIRDKGYNPKNHPFFEGNPNWKAPGINYEYTEEEFIECIKCSRDVVYFANNYAYSMTDEGVRQLNLRDYQEDVLETYQNYQHIVFLSSRQMGKCIDGLETLMLKNINNRMEIELPIFELFYQEKQKHKKLNIFDKIVYNLYNLLFKLNK
jgi:hypothetical protein